MIRAFGWKRRLGWSALVHRTGCRSRWVAGRAATQRSRRGCLRWPPQLALQPVNTPFAAWSGKLAPAATGGPPQHRFPLICPDHPSSRDRGLDGRDCTKEACDLRARSSGGDCDPGQPHRVEQGLAPASCLFLMVAPVARQLITSMVVGRRAEARRWRYLLDRGPGVQWAATGRVTREPLSHDSGATPI